MPMTRIICLFCLYGLSVVAVASEFEIYPANEQTEEQQQKDQAECYIWAKSRSDFDPIAPPPQPASDGAAKTEVTTDDILSNEQLCEQLAAQRRKEAEAAAQYAEKAADYNRAYKKCLEKRGYRVKQQ